MFKKNYKSVVLFICFMLLFSAIILVHCGTKNLGIIDFPPMTRFMKLYIPFGF